MMVSLQSFDQTPDTGFRNSLYNDPEETEVPVQEKSSRTESRSQGVSELDITIATIYVEDALHFRNVPFRPDKLSLYQVYQSSLVRYLFVVFPTFLLSLALAETPRVEAIDVHWQAVWAIELVCLVACFCRVVHLRFCLTRKGFWSDIKNWVILVTIGTMFVDMMVWLGFKLLRERDVIRVSRVLRPLLIINFSDNRNLRKLLRNIKKTVVDVFSVLLLIFLFIAIFAMMATKFFERRTLIDPHGDPYLTNFLDSYWNLYVLMTTANSPDVSLPAITNEQPFFFFFTPFSVITTFILMNILLAVVYKHYKLHLLEEVKVDVGITQSNLFKAFSLLKDPVTNHIHKEVWLKSYSAMGCPDTLQGLYWDYMVPSSDLMGISLHSFYKITDLLSSKIMIVITKKTWLEQTVPFIYNSNLSCYFRFLVSHMAFTLFYDILIFLNAVVLSLKDSPPILEDIFLALFNFEIVAKIYTHGPRKFSSTAWNCYDCLVIWSATIFSLVVDVEGFHDSKNEEMGTVFLDMVLTLRVLRLLKLLLSFPQLRHIVSTLMQIVPSMGSYALLLFLFYYSYAIIGMEAFAGKILNDTENCGNDALNGTDFVAEGYCILSFNNILYSFVVLWTLTLVNQWHILAEGFVKVTSQAARLFFLSFHVIIVLIILNIFLAFVIEAFMLQIELDKQRKQGIDDHLDERGVNARRESHPQNQPVWYKNPNISTEEEEARKVYIGTSPLEGKVRYKRQKGTKSYNQLLLEMFQEDIQLGAETGPEAVGSGVVGSLGPGEQHGKLAAVDEAGEEEKQDQMRKDDLSYGSLQDMDII